MLVFEERGKPEYPGKNLSEQRREPTTNSTHTWRRVQESNPGSRWWEVSALTTAPSLLPTQNTTSQGKQYFYKLPYLGHFSTIIVQSKRRRLVNRYCHDLAIRLAFTTFIQLRNLFSVKDSVPRELRSCVIYKLTCACCNACFIGETGCHFSTRARDKLSPDKSSHIFKQLLSSECCRQSCSVDCFEILDSAPTKFQLKLKEAMHILGKA